MKNPNSSFPKVPFVVAGVVVASGLILSWLRAAPPVPVAVIAGLDPSESIPRAQLGRSRAALARLSSALNPQTDKLMVWRVDRQTDEFYAQAPQGYESLLPILINHTKQPANDSGTFPADFWAQAAKRAADPESAPGRKVAIVLYSDGDNDDLSRASRERIRDAAKALAANQRVLGVWIYGAKQGNWDALRELFAPLRGRLHLFPLEQMAPAPLLESVDTARREAAFRDDEKAK